MTQHFSEFLAKVEHGEIIRIRKQGRTVARMVPDCDFMPGQQAADLFRGHRADAETANAIYAILSERYESGEHDVAARHNEHQS